VSLPAGLACFSIYIFIIANRVNLNSKFGEKYIWFVMCGLAGFWEILGLDMRFLGRKRENFFEVSATARINSRSLRGLQPEMQQQEQWQVRSRGRGTVWVEKRISQLRCSQKREQLRSK
jgi:hypothetical protein